MLIELDISGDTNNSTFIANERKFRISVILKKDIYLS